MRLKNYELKASSLGALIAVQSELGDKPCVIMDDAQITFSEIHAASNRVANALAALGTSKGDVVATYMQNSIDHVLLWFGCAKIGAVWAPLNIGLIKVDLAYAINQVAPRVMVVDEPLWDSYVDIRAEVRRDGMREVVRTGKTAPAGTVSFADLLTGEDTTPVVEIEWTDPACLICTGGSTGLPKAVLVPNGWYFGGIFRYQEMFRPTQDDCHLGIGQLYHTIGSAVDVLGPFYQGMTTVLTRWFSASRFWDRVRAHHATVSVLIGPAILALNAQAQRDDDAQNPLRLFATASGGMPRESIESFAKRFETDVLELYGQTETGPLGCISQRLDDRPYHSLGHGNGWADIMIGGPVGEACAAGEVGEILLRPVYPSTFMIGYYNKPEKTVEAWRDLWFHSGDMGFLDERGYLHFSGRAAHLIRRRGENIAAAEIETVILEHPKVERCAAFGVAFGGDEEIKVSVQLLPQSKPLDPVEIVQFCEERVAYFKVPRFVEFVDQLPLSVTKGEVERHKLKALGINGAWDRETAGYTVRRRA